MQAATFVFALALALRLLHIWGISDQPFVRFYLGDAESYHLWAKSIASGDWLGDEVFYQAPLYPYLLGAVYSLGSDSPWIPRVVQALLGSAACVLVMLTGWQLYGRSVGLTAGIILTFLAPAVFFDGMIQKTSFALFLLCAGLYLLTFVNGSRIWPVATAGIAFGSLALVRENAMLLAVVVVTWLASSGKEHRGIKIVQPAVFLTAMLCVLIPVAVRNYVVAGEFLLTTSQFGPNFYIGNNPRADGSYVALVPRRGDARYEREDAIRLAEADTGRTLTPREVSQFWTQKAFQYIRDQPRDWLRLVLRKTQLLVTRTEEADTEDLYTHADHSFVLWSLSWFGHYGLLVPLAVIGLFAAWPYRGMTWLLVALLATYAVSVVIFFVFARYRFPLSPFLALFAAVGIVEGMRFWREASTAKRTACVVLTAAAALVANLPTTSHATMRAVTAQNVAGRFRERGELDEAEEWYLVSLEHASDAASYHGLGLVALERNDLVAAETNFTEAIRLQPRDADSHYRLGRVRHVRGRLAAASRAYADALAITPGDARIHFAAAQAHEAASRADEAIDHYRLAGEHSPDWSDPWAALAFIYASHHDPKVRDMSQALEAANLAIEHSGGEDAFALDALAAALANAGDYDRATEVSRRAVQAAIDADDPAYATDVRTRLALYSEGRPYREPKPERHSNVSP